jgi:hypothetical protein
MLQRRYRPRSLIMSFEDDLRRVEAGVNTLDAQRMLWLLESNLRRFEQHRDQLRVKVRQ